MALLFGALERMLLTEQKNKYNNRLVIGGLEKYVLNWAADQKDSARAAQATSVAESLAGYDAADVLARAEKVSRAIELLHGPPAVSCAAVQENDAAVDADPAEASNELDDEKAPPPLRMRAATDYGLDASVTRLQNVGPSYAKRLAKLGVFTVGDLLYLFPNRYIDYSQLKTISQLMYGEEVTLLLTVCELKTRDTHKGAKVTNVLLADPTGTITAVFFNQPFLQRQLKSGMRIFVSGRVEQDLNRLTFRHPEWEPLSKELVHTGRVVPVYPLTEGLTNRWLRRLVYSVVEFWAPRMPDSLPEEMRAQEKLLDLATALREVHFPSSLEKMQAARRRLAFEEFLYMQLGVLRQRQKWREQTSQPLHVDQQVISELTESLPFQLTRAQKRTLDEILVDIQQTHPMSRLLQGDVGSGKTVVAAAAMRVAVKNGTQAAVMAPTEILAEQHFRTLSGLFGDKVRIRLLIGSLKNKEKEDTRAAIASGEVEVAVGTHALIQETVRFRDLGLVVIDEQHRFGVEQRAAIRAKGYNPHILVMSATPIPRTLALTVYGDLDLSIIDEMPPGRQQIQTKWLEPTDRERAYSFIMTQVRRGHQAFIICPLIEESEAIDAKAAVEEYDRLRTSIFPNLRIGLIHGKLKASEKDQAMGAFRDHDLDVLVATSVVEVGIDVPNATVMLIEGADRFGLAQLHQFRGRVGRGQDQSYCLLLAEKKSSVADERLRVIESSQDGFRLAEEDLKLRGPGEFFGTRQSGLPDLKIAKLSDVRYLEQARRVATRLHEVDPDLKQPGHQLLASRVNEFWKGKGDLS